MRGVEVVVVVVVDVAIVVLPQQERFLGMECTVGRLAGRHRPSPSGKDREVSIMFWRPTTTTDGKAQQGTTCKTSRPSVRRGAIFSFFCREYIPPRRRAE